MSKNTRNRILLTAVAALLLVAVTVGGTMAWLAADTDPVTNTFKPTNLSVGLDETPNLDFTMIPGATIDKDPKVTYTSDVPAWLFVEITESDNLDDFITYNIADGWTLVPDTTNVYYREVAATPNEGPFSVIEDEAGVPDKVTVKKSVTKVMMDALYNTDGSINEEACPKLTFKAYIIQKTAGADAKTAWAAIADVDDDGTDNNTNPDGSTPTT